MGGCREHASRVTLQEWQVFKADIHQEQCNARTSARPRSAPAAAVRHCSRGRWFQRRARRAGPEPAHHQPAHGAAGSAAGLPLVQPRQRWLSPDGKGRVVAGRRPWAIAEHRTVSPAGQWRCRAAAGDRAHRHGGEPGQGGEPEAGGGHCGVSQARGGGAAGTDQCATGRAGALVAGAAAGLRHQLLFRQPGSVRLPAAVPGAATAVLRQGPCAVR